MNPRRKERKKEEEEEEGRHRNDNWPTTTETKKKEDGKWKNLLYIQRRGGGERKKAEAEYKEIYRRINIQENIIYKYNTNVLRPLLREGCTRNIFFSLEETQDSSLSPPFSTPQR